MDVYERNLDLIQKYSQELYQIITKEEPKIYIDIEKAEEGFNYIMRRNQISAFVHSLYDVDNELAMMCKNISDNEDTIILFGLGCGYALPYIKVNYPNVKAVVVIEPSLQMFKLFLENRSLAEYSYGMNVSYIVNREKDFVGEVIAKYLTKNTNTKLIANITYINIFNDIYNFIITRSVDLTRITMANYSVNRGLVHLWLVNMLTNWRFNHFELSEIKHLFKDKSIVIVGAGPSLNKNIHKINQLKDSAIVIAIGSAIKILDAKGIIPHFRIAYDGAPSEMQAFDGIDTKTAPLIYSNKLFCKVVPNYEGVKIHMRQNDDFIDTYISKKNGLDESDIIETGASIAISAVNMAVLFGCKSIIFMGMDLSINKNKFYAEGLGVDKEEVEITNKHIESIDIYGETVYVDKGLYTVLLGLEYIVSSHPNIKFIDATEGGIVKKGMHVLTAEQVINNILQKDDSLQTLISEVVNLEKTSLKHDFYEINDPIFKEIDKECESIIQISDTIIKRLKQLKKRLASGHNINKLNTIIDGLDNFEKQFEEIDLYIYWIKPALRYIFDAINTACSYKGTDKLKMVEIKLKGSLGKAAELTKYMDLFLDMYKALKRDKLDKYM